MSVRKIKIAQGNTAPSYLLTAEREGVPIDLTGCTADLIIAKGSTITNTGHQACVVITPTAGRVEYTPQSGDFATPGSYKADLKITYGDGSVEIMNDQLKFKVRKTLS